ncbi:MAG TPA: YMGG-like glycine zipper-containing protein [Thermoanaerobaculia bacterium]|nr:YMGG-like glycine zipper-containing protein [Thermoanaerobaculia bacterium]
MPHARRLVLFGALALFAVLAVPAAAQNTAAPAAPPAPATWTFTHTPAAVVKDLGAFLYPKNNQSAEQQNKDTTECLLFANDQTGINLDTFKKTGQNAEEKQAAQAPKKGGAVKGAAKGAAAGAVVGEVTNDDAGKGAGYGAAAGAVAGRRAQKKGEQQAAQAQKDAEAKAIADAKETVKKPFFACLDAKGYSAK